MSEVNLEQLGFNRSDIEKKVIERAVENLLTTRALDEFDEFYEESPVAKKIRDRVKERIDQRVTEIADAHIIPNVDALIEGVVLQKTNEWGEAKGEALSFREYLVQRAENYMTETVNHNGQTKAEAGGFSWRASTTRITYLMDRHIQYAIQASVESALKNAHSALSEGIAETARQKLKELSDSLRVNVKG